MTEYKKTYEGDYSKSYRDYAAWAIENNESRRKYQTVSKKLDQKPYDKSEKSNLHSVAPRPLPKESERVYSEGRSKEDRAKIKSNWSQEDIYTPQSTPQPKEQKQPTVVASNAAIKTDSSAKNEYQPSSFPETKIEDDGNYNHFEYPIEEIGFNRYLNVKTKKEIDGDGARNVLQMAGYIPKGSNNLGGMIFVFVLANIFFAKLAPFLALGYGIMKMTTARTTWIRNVKNQVYRYSLPASEQEVALNKKVGQICLVIGVISAVIQYRDLLPLS